jgi:hypothetical protein
MYPKSLGGALLEVTMHLDDPETGKLILIKSRGPAVRHYRGARQPMTEEVCAGRRE